ncbi:unnamed protein product [Paramecium sonneborni]|uniref:Dynein heavy chain C-terminal domain-containing protein n=1 Tax=Paramecium sonneborni TaxID=65129 RepID=A0A8S1PN15_9CILI|nr:unnamed protein product [Paramecium sonneborni]
MFLDEKALRNLTAECNYGERKTYQKTREEYLDHIKQLPLPQIFNFHPNSDITKDMNETNLIQDSFLLYSAQGRSSNGQSFEQVLEQLVKTIMTNFPDEFNYEQGTEKYPFNSKESMNTILTQKLCRGIFRRCQMKLQYYGFR